jgi:hypothetical protein
MAGSNRDALWRVAGFDPPRHGSVPKVMHAHAVYASSTRSR